MGRFGMNVSLNDRAQFCECDSKARHRDGRPEAAPGASAKRREATDAARTKGQNMNARIDDGMRLGCCCLRSVTYGRGWLCNRGFSLHPCDHVSDGDPLLDASRAEYEPCSTCLWCNGARSAGSQASAAAQVVGPRPFRLLPRCIA